MSPEYRARIEANRPIFAARVKQQYGVNINQGPFGINTFNAHALKKYADSRGKGKAFHDAVMDAYWLRGLDVSDPQVLRNLLDSVGLDGNEMEAILQQPEFGAQVNADIETAYDNNMSGVPALVFGEKYLVMGAQPYPVLKQVAEKVLAEEKA